MGFMAVVVDCPRALGSKFHLLDSSVCKVAGGRAGDFRLNRGPKFLKPTPISRYFPANDSAALAAKALDLLGLDSITFISCQS